MNRAIQSFIRKTARLRHQGIPFAWAALALPVLLTFISTTAEGQSSTNQPRANPAPWRPSFTPINPISNQQSLGNASQSGPVQQPVRPGTGNAASGAPTNPTPGSLPIRQTDPNQLGFRDNSSGVPSRQNGTQPGQPITNRQPTQQPNPSGLTRIARNQLPTSRPGGKTKVTKTLDKLPNEAGQVWREYDISPYTSRVTTSEEPQKAILDWILRETGNEMWFNEPLGVLHANKKSLYVYHTPEIQGVVKSIVDRFVWTRAQVQKINVNLVTVENPNWRSQSYTMLQPIDVKSPGVEAWMISKENAAILLGQLQRRGDFKKHSSGTLTNHDGQLFSLEKTSPVQFIRNIRWVPNQVPNYQPLMTSLDEGYRLSISSLSAINSESIEATIKCDVDQVEKLTTVPVSLPGAGGRAEQMNLQIPQMVSWRLHERFRWPNDQVLLLSCGVVATPEPETRQSILPFNRNRASKRADALLFIDYRGPANEAAVPLTAEGRVAPIQQR